MSSNTPKPRQAFTNAEKKEVCEWFNLEQERTGDRPHWKKVQKWFADTHSGKVISQPTISNILTKRAADLLEPSESLAHPQQKKRREVSWPKLDEALFEWHKRMEKRIPISGLVLKEKAKDFFVVLYPGETLPKFSDGWLDTFKKHHKIKEHKQHGESGSSECEIGQQQMDTIREILREYDLDDTYNFDETGYYYRMQPDRRLCTEQLEGTKKDKLRITVGLTCNGTGSHKLQPWVIGTAENPRCFKYINRSAMGVIYRYNTTAWMRAKIMIEYLHWFDRKMRGRKVVLLLDNFSAHELGVKEIGGTTALKNTLIVWLPPNTTSKWQPLDQGIISAWKAHTRRHFVRYLVRKVEKLPEGADLPVINILQAIQWAVEAWNNDIKPSTIFNCFTKSSVKLFEPSYLPTALAATTGVRVTPIPILDAEDEADMQSIREELQASFAILQSKSHIREAPELEKFLDPREEQVDDDPDFLEEHILNSFLPEDPIQNAADENDEVEHPKAEIEVAIKYLEYLEIFQLQQKNPDAKTIAELVKMRREMEVKRLEKLSNQVQGKITMYFKGASHVE